MELEDNPEFARVLFGVPAPRKIIIGGKKYDIETAEKMFDLPITAQDLGDLTWEMTSLYRTRGGVFFLAGWGLEETRWACEAGGEIYPGSGILPLTDGQVRNILEIYKQADLYEQYFGDVPEAGEPGCGSNLCCRLTIFRSTKLVMLDGSQKYMNPSIFNVLLLLADRAVQSQGATKGEIEKLYEGSARETIRKLRDALAVESEDPEAVRAIVENVPNWGYRLILKPNDIVLRP